MYFKDKLGFWHEFVPQVLLMLALFGYMDFMIIKKWLNNYYGYEDQAPGIINLMIAMFLEGGKVKGRPLFTGQVFVTNVMARK